MKSDPISKEEVLLGGGAKTQRTLASPSYPSGQVQIGT